MSDHGQRDTADRLQRIEEAVGAQSRAMQMMLTNQKLEIEMLAKVLEAVTRKPDEETDPLADLLAELVRASYEHSTKLDLILRHQKVAAHS